MWKTKEEVKDNISTKWATIYMLVEYILRSDEGPWPEADEDGKLVFPDKSNDWDENAKAKIVIYIEYIQNIEWAKEVFDLQSYFKSSDIDHH